MSGFEEWRAVRVLLAEQETPCKHEGFFVATPPVYPYLYPCSTIGCHPGHSQLRNQLSFVLVERMDMDLVECIEHQAQLELSAESVAGPFAWPTA
jgi:hypothetical protein